MGGCSCADDCEFISPRTIVLVGKTGNGKSATGNSVLGMKVLLSKKSSYGVTISSELQTTRLEDGQLINVIDTSDDDELEDEAQTLEDFLCDSPESLKETLSLCGICYVLFDDKTKDEAKKSNQNQIKDPKEQEILLEAQRFKHILELVETKLKKTTLKLEQQLTVDRAACLKAEKKTKSSLKKADNENRKLRGKLEEYDKKIKKLSKKMKEEMQWRQREEVFYLMILTGLVCFDWLLNYFLLKGRMK